MALWAFHNNPGIGGFGESTPVLFDGNRRRGRKKRSTEPPFSLNCDNRVSNETASCYAGSSGDGNTVCTASNQYSIGEGDLVCQIVKELVDNAVDACRSPTSDSDSSQHASWSGKKKKRIRVDIRPFINSESFGDFSTASCPSKAHCDGVLQLTVTDTGCGMENIQTCVNAFQSNKGEDPIIRSYDNQTVNNVSSGRYGIGLTLCLLHAQRCVPNSRACISSATPKSKFLTRAFFEVDKRQDSIKCVQEEIINFPTSEKESGTCVSLLVPGGTTAKLVWPRLKDYFTRFGLCTKLHFELDVLAPTLSKLPIIIRPRKLGDAPALKKREYALESSRDCVNSDEWDDLLDGDDSEETNDTEALVNEKQKCDDCSDENSFRQLDPHRYKFVNAVKFFWPNCNVAYDNVARSVRSIRNYDKETTLTGKETIRQPEVQLEVSMAVCPDSDNDNKGNNTVDSADATSNNVSGDEKAATLQLVRIVNDVPIMESAEAHLCGLVHGIANKGVWGSFGLTIDRSTTIAPDTSLCTPCFLLRDNSLIAPFINKNLNHKQLKADAYDTNRNQDYKEEKKKRKREALRQKDLYPANLRIGKILVVVQVRAAPSSLPLPTLSKGRLPLNYQPVDAALQLGLRDCIVSLKSTNPALFLTTSQLRTVERDARYIPGIASAVSRIIFRSKNQLLQSKSLELFPKKPTGNNGRILQKPSSKNCRILFESSTVNEQEQGHEHGRKSSKMSILATAFESRLRLAIKARNELMNMKRCKRQKDSSVKSEEFHDFDTDKESKDGEESFEVSIPNESGSFSRSSTVGQVKLENASNFSFRTQSLQRVPIQQKFEKYSCKASCDASILPMTEIVIENHPTLSTNEDEDDFDDCL